MFRFISAVFLFIFVTFFLAAPKALAQEVTPAQEEFIKARVVGIVDSGEKDIAGISRPYQTLKVQLLEGSQKGEVIEIDHGQTLTITPNQLVKENETVVVLKLSESTGETLYQVVDKYRLDTILAIAALFFVLVTLFGKVRGLGSFISLGVSLAVIINFIVPQILSGGEPIFTSFVGSLMIMVSSLYLSHGFNRRTTLAVVATFGTLVITILLSYIFVNISHLSGLGSDEAYSLRFGQTGNINFKGMLLGGIIIGLLGVLDDVTTTQTAAVLELHKANPNFKLNELLKRGMNIGNEHIYSLVNTLVLAYAGASLPIFLYFVLNPTNQPLWVMLNGEYVTEEIIRALAGSMGLLLAVPISTILAGYMIKRRKFIQI